MAMWSVIGRALRPIPTAANWFGAVQMVVLLVAALASGAVVGVKVGLAEGIAAAAIVLLVLIFIAAVGFKRDLDRWEASGPSITVGDLEMKAGTLDDPGQTLAGFMVIPITNQRGEGQRTGTIAKRVHGKLSIRDSNGFALPDLQARWQEKDQQPQRGPYASTTGTEVATLDLDPNGLPHYMDTVMQPMGKTYVHFWGQGGAHAVGLVPPVEIELTLEGSNVEREFHRFEIDVAAHAGLELRGKKLE